MIKNDAMKKKEIDIAQEFALKNKYTSVVLYDNWDGSNIYAAEGEDSLCIGYPALIIVSESNPRFATTEETFSIMGVNPVEDKNYSGEAL